MMKKSIMAAAVALTMASGASMALAASADNIGPGGKSAQTEAVAQVSMAQSLVAYGDANKDAMSLIVAAKILKANPTHAAGGTKSTEGKEGKSGKKSGAAVDNSVAAVLSRAKQYAAGRKDLIAIADDVAAASSKGRVRGPAYLTDRVLVGHTDVWTFRFRGGEPATVAIRGDGDTDLDFYVYDEYGNLGPYDDDGTDYTQLSWTPRHTGIFRIKIVNHGDVYNRYQLLTN